MPEPNVIREVSAECPICKFVNRIGVIAHFYVRDVTIHPDRVTAAVGASGARLVLIGDACEHMQERLGKIYQKENSPEEESAPHAEPVQEEADTVAEEG
jgi:hypothetical protein